MKLAISAMKLPPRFSQTAANKKKRPIGLFFYRYPQKFDGNNTKNDKNEGISIF